MTIKSPYMDRVARRNVGHNGREAEKSLSKRIGGKLTPASGAMVGAKGDMSKGEFLIEAKATQNDSMSLKKSWCHKIYQEALEKTKRPAIAIAFTNDSGRSEKRDRWVMLTESDYLELIGD